MSNHPNRGPKGPTSPTAPSGIRFAVPDDVKFADLRLTRDTQTGDLEFDWTPIERICAASGVDVAVFRDHDEDRVCALLLHWYDAHCAAGGEGNPVMEDLIAEAKLEDDHGEGFSHAPGRA